MRELSPLRLLGTALLAGTLILRAARILGHLESVRVFYFSVPGPLWTMLGAVLLSGPWLTAAAAVAALWLRRNRGVLWGIAAVCGAAFFTLEEGLTVFARAVNGNSGYVGAEPLLSILVLGISMTAVFRARRPRER